MLGNYAYDPSSKCTNGKVKCTLCPQTFEDSETRKDHIVKEHYKIQSHKCDKCTEIFKSSTELEQHIQESHKSPELSCEKCGTVLHSKTHNCNETSANSIMKSNECSFCKTSFPTVSTLKNHMATMHMDMICSSEIKKPNHKCNKCEETFKDRTLLLKHVKESHLESKEISHRDSQELI